MTDGLLVRDYDWAASLPADRSIHAFENIVTVLVRRGDREGARAVVNRLPAGQARQAAESILRRSEQE